MKKTKTTNKDTAMPETKWKRTENKNKNQTTQKTNNSKS